MQKKDKIEFVSIIIPAFNRGKELSHCLEQLKMLKSNDFEVIVVDNNSSDDTRLVAERFGAKVYSYSASQNANSCRNFGALKARGSILVFLDSDVIPVAGIVETCRESFSDESVAALIGTYSVNHRNPNASSQYKNYWIRYSYINSAESVGWIFGAVSAIRKSVFTAISGFSDEFQARDGIDDIELGTRLTEAGYKVIFSPALEVEHLKSYNFFSLLKNQFDRSAGFFTLAAASKNVSKSLTSGVFNVYPAFVYSTALAPVLLFSFGISFVFSEIQYYFLLPATIYGGLNVPFVSSYFAHRGYSETVKIVPIIYFDHLICSLGVAAGFLKSVLKSLNQARIKVNKEE